MVLICLSLFDELLGPFSLFLHWVIFQVHVSCKLGMIFSACTWDAGDCKLSFKTLVNNCLKVVAAVSPTNSHYEWSFFKPRIPLNMPVGFWVPAVKWCCFWQGLVSKWGIISLISVVWSASHDILSVFSFYTLSEQSHKPRQLSVGLPKITMCSEAADGRTVENMQSQSLGSHGVQG